MKKLTILIYGVIAYLSFHAVILYAMAFIGNFGLTNSLDSAPTKPMLNAIMINLGLLSMFAIQHSGMARKSFKNWIQKFIPAAAERSTFVLISNIALFLVLFLWEPIGGVIWQAESQFSQITLISLYMVGWSIVFISSFLINHFHLFGLQQVWYNFKGKEIPPSKFTTPAFYKFVRHPLYVGFIMLSWAATTMTVAHLIFAVMITAYILVGIRFEEKDLKDELGSEYETYQEQVPMIVPRMPKSDTGATKSA